MDKVKPAIAFLAGAVFGGATVWYIVKERYAQLAEEEIESVKEAYASRGLKKESAEDALRRYRGADENTQEGQTPAVTTKVADKGNIAEYAGRIKIGVPIDYHKMSVSPERDTQENPPKLGEPGEIPYVISPEEFDELDGYTLISLTYFADGVLSDEHGAIIDDPEEIVGDALNHFGEYEEDAVFVRNDAKRCDYEILRDERDYDEFRATLPNNI